MLTPTDARKLTEAAGDRLQIELERYERFIRDAAEKGKSGVNLDYIDCMTEDRIAATRALEERGFRIEVARVGQEAPAYYAFW